MLLRLLSVLLSYTDVLPFLLYVVDTVVLAGVAAVALYVPVVACLNVPAPFVRLTVPTDTDVPAEGLDVPAETLP